MNQNLGSIFSRLYDPTAAVYDHSAFIRLVTDFSNFNGFELKKHIKLKSCIEVLS